MIKLCHFIENDIIFKLYNTCKSNYRNELFIKRSRRMFSSSNGSDEEIVSHLTKESNHSRAKKIDLLAGMEKRNIFVKDSLLEEKYSLEEISKMSLQMRRSVTDDALVVSRRIIESLQKFMEQMKGITVPKYNESALISSIVMNRKHAGKVIQPQTNARSSQAMLEMNKVRQSLPVYNFRKELLDGIDANQVVLVIGATGSGKTTQIPQFILEEQTKKGLPVKIICTQPRRISAISVADRVADERCEDRPSQSAPGNQQSSVGYQIRLENHSSPATKLLFCTTGIMLRKIQSDRDLAGVTHVVIDELHERSLDSDFVLVLLRDLLKTRKDLKVILMSATMDPKIFVDYFVNELGGDVPVLRIPGKTFPVKNLYIEDALALTGHVWQQKKKDSEPKAATPSSQIVPEELLNKWINNLKNTHPTNVIDYLTEHFGNCEDMPNDLIVSLVRKLDVIAPSNTNSPHAVLIFMPGVKEIETLCADLRRQKGNWEVHELHGLMDSEVQKLVFVRPPSGVRKIVVATNVAESSITIDDIGYVINACRQKITQFDAEANLTSLGLTWAARDSLTQRSGRAGRIAPGICFHLVPQEMATDFLASHTDPEIMRTPLDQLCLQTKHFLGNDSSISIESFLNRALSPPPMKSVHLAIDKLRMLGALDQHENMTPLGNCLVKLPMNPQIAKSLVMACILGCVDPVIAIIGILSHRTVFVNPSNKDMREQVKSIHEELAEGKSSDHYAQLRAFQKWLETRPSQRRAFAIQHFLHHNTLLTVNELTKQYSKILTDTGIIRFRSSHYRAMLNRHSQDWAVVKACLVAGLYPNLGRLDFAVRGPNKPPLIRVDGHPAIIHAASVNSARPGSEWPHNWCMYFEKLRMTTVTLFDTTDIYPLAISLFAEGNSSVNEITVRENDYGAATEPLKEFIALAEAMTDSSIRAMRYSYFCGAVAVLRPDLQRIFPQKRRRQLLEKAGFVLSHSGSEMLLARNPDGAPAESLGENSKSRTCIALGEKLLIECEDQKTRKAIIDARDCLESIVNYRATTGTETPAHREFIDILCSALIENDRSSRILLTTTPSELSIDDDAFDEEISNDVEIDKNNNE